MTRPVFDSLEEVAVHHKARRVVGADLVAIEKYTSYETVLFATPDIASLRQAYELVEVYVKVNGDQTKYEPLRAEHFAVHGSWNAVMRRRHPSNDARIVGMMLAKDETDVIPEVIANLVKHLDALYYLADDETARAIVACAPKGWARAVPLPAGALKTDGLRQYLLEQARLDALTDGDPRPMWVVSAQGDEIYHDDLKQHIRLAQAERATLLTCQVATFLLHESQNEAWDWSLPLEKRLTHYIWDLGEHAAHLDFPWVYYDVREHMRAHPHGTWPAKWASARPVRKHYPFRSPEQARRRIDDRLKSGWQPHYEHYLAIFMGNEAAGRPVKRYHGWFPEAERVGEGIW